MSFRLIQLSVFSIFVGERWEENFFKERKVIVLKEAKKNSPQKPRSKDEFKPAWSRCPTWLVNLMTQTTGCSFRLFQFWNVRSSQRGERELKGLRPYAWNLTFFTLTPPTTVSVLSVSRQDLLSRRAEAKLTKSTSKHLQMIWVHSPWEKCSTHETQSSVTHYKVV